MDIEHFNNNKELLNPLSELAVNLDNILYLFEKFNLKGLDLYTQLETANKSINSFDIEIFNQNSIWSRRKLQPVQ